MRSFSTAMAPFFTQSATKKIKKTITESIPKILANQRSVISVREDFAITLFIVVSDLSVDLLITISLIPLFATRERMAVERAATIRSFFAKSKSSI